MGYILEYVEVDELSKTVKFFGSEKRIEVDDLDVGLSAFYSECNDVAMEINGCSSLIEKTAFNRVTWVHIRDKALYNVSTAKVGRGRAGVSGRLAFAVC